MKRGLSIIFLFVISALCLYPQNLSLISHYVFPEFKDGVILMKDGTKVASLLNYNSASEQVVYIDKGNKLALSDGTIEKVDTVFIQDKKFVLVDGNFMEVISGSNFDMYVNYRCKVTLPKDDDSGYGNKSRTSSSRTYRRALGMEGMFELSLPEDYIVKPYIEYKIRNNAGMHNVKNMKQLMKLYKDQKKQIKEYTGINSVSIDNAESVLKFVDYMQNIN